MPKDRVLSVGRQAERAEHQRLTQRVGQQVKTLQDSLASITASLRDQLIEERLPDLAPTDRAAVLAAVNAPKEKKTKEQDALLQKHAKAVKVSDEELTKRFPEYPGVRDQIRKATTAQTVPNTQGSFAPSVRTSRAPAPARLPAASAARAVSSWY